MDTIEPHEAKLNDNQLRFIDEYLSQLPLNAKRAYQAVYGVPESSAGPAGARMISLPHIQQEIARRQVATHERFKLEADDVFRELFLVATADPRELSEHYVGSCRHCHGFNFEYQRTPDEFRRDLAAYIKFRKDDARPDPLGLEFPNQGGVGFNRRNEPNPDCPECFGEGIPYEVFKDTRKLSRAAARLYAGVKKTNGGLQLLTRSQDKAVELAGRCLGVFKDTTQHTGPNGGPIAVTALPTDPIEAAAIYQTLVGGK